MTAEEHRKERRGDDSEEGSSKDGLNLCNFQTALSVKRIYLFAVGERESQNTDYVILIDRAHGGWGLHSLQEGTKRRISTRTIQEASLCNTQTILYAWVEHLLPCTADKHTICQQKWPPSYPAHLLRTKHAEELLCT